MLLVIFLTGAILWNLPWSKYESIFLVSAVEPGYLDFDNLPDTNFSCEGKVIGGYYADVETGCQMFHVCTIGQKSEIADIKFLCLNGTVFDQETRVCERLDEVDCSKSESFFDLNLELYGNIGGGYGIPPEDENRENEEQSTCEDDYEDDGTCKKSETDRQQNPSDVKDDVEYDWEDANTAVSTTPMSTSSTTSSTTTAKQMTTSLKPPSTPVKFHYRPESLPVSTTTPNTVLQLLALHEAFQENLRRREPTKLLPSAPSGSKMTSTKTSTQLPVHPYQLSSAPAHSHYTVHSNKLPNVLSNLSQNVHFNNLPPNRNHSPQSEYKPDPSLFYNTKQYNQKIPPNRTSTPSTLLRNENAKPIYSYRITNDGGEFDQFRTSTLVNKPTVETFKMQTIPHFSHSSLSIAQRRPQGFRVKMSLSPEEDVETNLRTTRKLENLSHSNFPRASPDYKPNSNTSDRVSVVLTTSSVSSSISSKPISAISNSSTSSTNRSTNSYVGNNGSNYSSKSNQEPKLAVNYPTNISDINESLTEESYYEESRADYDDNSQEYKDLFYHTDVQKI